MKIDIETKGSLVYVRVQLDRPKEGKFKKNKLMTKDILQILNQRGIDTTICVKAPPVVTNKKNNQFLFGEWVFETPKLKPTIRKKTRKTRKKVEKVLDKSPEDVIIEVEKKETLISSRTQSVTEE